MKKTFFAFIAVLLILSLLAGCGASGAASDISASSSGASVTYGDTADNQESVEYSYASDSEKAGGIFTTATKSVPLSEKIIYSANANIETTAFDETIEKVYAMLDEYGAFLESSSISGSDYTSKYYGYQTYRSASFVVRVPADKFEALTGNLDSLGNVTSSSTGTDNITARYTDTESRLKTYRIEEERLLAMLEKTDTVADMLTIEERLAEIRYEIETLTSTLTNWQNEVDYSTVNLSVQEVEELSEKVPTQRSYWEEVRDGFLSSLKSVGRFFTNIFKGFIIALPSLIVAAAIVAVIIVIVRKTLRGRLDKKRDKPDGKR